MFTLLVYRIIDQSSNFLSSLSSKECITGNPDTIELVDTNTWKLPDM